jgi:hypothetical protein
VLFQLAKKLGGRAVIDLTDLPPQGWSLSSARSRAPRSPRCRRQVGIEIGGTGQIRGQKSIIRRWALRHRSDKSLAELAEMYNPCIRGWINYYSHFYRTQLRPTLQRIDAYVIRWARRKYKRLRPQPKGARDWLERSRRANPTLLAYWPLCHGNTPLAA